MKLRTLITIALIALVAIAVDARKPKAGGKGMAKFNEQVFNFGTIKEADGPVSHVFEFVNTGNGNLVVIDATAQCGCTRPEYPEKPIAPGKKGKIKVTYNPAARPGSFDKVVTVRTDGEPKKVRLKIKGNVLPK